MQWRRQVDETGEDRTSAEGARFLGRFRGMLPQEVQFNSRVSKTLFLVFLGSFINNLKATHR